MHTQVVSLINEQYKVGDELKRSVRDDILRLIEANTYRGRRHAAGLPCNGQKTKWNAKTARKFKRHILYDVK
jgi:small subunit ribosomal protein S13